MLFEDYFSTVEELWGGGLELDNTVMVVVVMRSMFSTSIAYTVVIFTPLWMPPLICWFKISHNLK